MNREGGSARGLTHHREGSEEWLRSGPGEERRGRGVQGGGGGRGREEHRLREGRRRVEQVRGLGVGRRVGRGLAHEADVGDPAGRRLGRLPGVARGLGLGLVRGRRGGLGRGVAGGALRRRGAASVRGRFLVGPSVLLQELRAARELRELWARGAPGVLGAAAPFRVRSWEEMAGVVSPQEAAGPGGSPPPKPQNTAPPRRKSQ